MTFNNYFCKAHSENDIPSAKRFWGGVMIACSQVCIIIAATLSFIEGEGITSTIKDLIEVDIIVGASLIGLQTITRMIGKGNSISVDNSINHHTHAKEIHNECSEE